MFVLNGKVISIDSLITVGEVAYPNMRDPEVRARLGVIEQPDQARPQPEEHYFISHDENGFEVYTLKNPEQIKEIESGKILRQITVLETQSGVVRVVREFLLAQAVITAASAGVDEPTLYAVNIGYRKLKDLELTIESLRSKLQ